MRLAKEDSDSLWIERQPQDRREELMARRQSFRLHRVPRWLRDRILEADRRLGWGFPRGSMSGWEALQQFQSRFYLDSKAFDHCGSCGEAFVSQPNMLVSEANAFAAEVAEKLRIDFAVDDMAPWHPSHVWIAWTNPK